MPQTLDGQRILVPDVNDRCRAPVGIGGNGHAFEDAVRVRLHDHAVHKRAGIAFVAVADEVLFVARSSGHHSPLASGRKPAPSAAAEATGSICR